MSSFVNSCEPLVLRELRELLRAVLREPGPYGNGRNNQNNAGVRALAHLPMPRFETWSIALQR
jgi:hypothetical protein